MINRRKRDSLEDYTAVMDREGEELCQGTETEICCLAHFHVDFQEVGLDFILSPRSLNFGLCLGDCSSGKVSQSPQSLNPQVDTHI